MNAIMSDVCCHISTILQEHLRKYERGIDAQKIYRDCPTIGSLTDILATSIDKVIIWYQLYVSNGVCLVFCQQTAFVAVRQTI